MLMRFELNTALVSTKGGNQYMNMQSAWGKKYAERYRYLFTITGCDIVTAFNGRGKRTAWDAWSIFGESARSFIK